MVTIRRYRHLILLLCAALATGSLVLGAAVADAGLIEVPTAPEVTGAVEEVTKGVVPPVKEATEAVPPPVTEVTETVTPPVKEAAETVTHPVEEAAHEATQAVPPPPSVPTPKVPAAPNVQVPATPKVPAAPPVHLPGGGSGSGSGGGATKTVTEAAKTVTHAVEETVNGATHPARSAGGGAATGTATPDVGAGRSANHVVASTEAAHPGATGTTPDPQEQIPGTEGRGDNKFKAPSTDGAVRAPVPKWVAYIWPAIALTRPDLANLLRGWDRAGMRILLPAIAAGAGDLGTSDGAQGVAGVQASSGGGGVAAGSGSDHSSSPFSKIPSAIGGFTSSVPHEALAYLILVAILIAAVFAGVKYEMARHNRRAP